MYLLAGAVFAAGIAGCPDKVCVNTGRLSAGIPIICLPNRLVIEFEEDETDAAVR